MDTPLYFGTSHRDILDRTTHVTTWQQANYVTRHDQTEEAATVQRQEEETFEQLWHRVATHTQVLQEKLSDHSTVLQTFNDGLATLQKRKEEGHAGLDDERIDLKRNQAPVQTRCHTLDTEIIIDQAALKTGCDADTAEYN